MVQRLDFGFCLRRVIGRKHIKGNIETEIVAAWETTLKPEIMMTIGRGARLRIGIFCLLSPASGFDPSLLMQRSCCSMLLVSLAMLVERSTHKQTSSFHPHPPP
jgi:hypothetical protein